MTDRVDRAARIVAAGTAATYAALIDPDALVRWLPPEDHAAGMSSSLRNLAAYLER